VAVGADGTIYAAGAGNRQTTAVPAAPQPAQVAGATTTIVIQAGQPAPPLAPVLTPDGSEIYRIQTDGYERRIWNHAQDLVYALAFDARGRLVAGTGNHGNLYRIDNDHSFTRLLNVDPTQITGLVQGPNGRLFAVTGNIGKVLSIGPGAEASGTIESEVLDADAFTYWGRLTKQPETPGVTFETRSGNLSRPQRNWSPWARLTADRVASPPARFLQYRATLSDPSVLSEVYVAYQMKNVAPVIDAVEITPPNYRFPAPAGPPVPGTPANPVLSLPSIGQHSPHSGVGSAGVGSEGSTFPALTWAKGQIGVRWTTHDDNGDTLLFKVEIRGENETVWKPIHDQIREHYLSWDSTAFADGKYVVRVTATDAPSNPPADALTATRESDPFLIDNTPPMITLATANNTVQIHAKDALSTLDKAEYSIDGGDWIVVEPTSRLTDSTEHDYRITVRPAPGVETTVAFRVEDAYGNQAVAKTVLK